MQVLTNVIDVHGVTWKLVLTWPQTCPLWCHAVDDAEVLHWGQFENAIGWRAEHDDVAACGNAKWT